MDLSMKPIGNELRHRCERTLGSDLLQRLAIVNAFLDAASSAS